MCARLEKNKLEKSKRKSMCVKANNVLEKTDINYLQDEVRNGFLISTPVKQAWSTAIEVLSAIDLICKKYGSSGVPVGKIRGRNAR